MRKAKIDLHHPEQLEARVSDYHDGKYPEFVCCILETEAVIIEFYFDDVDEIQRLAEQIAIDVHLIKEKRRCAPEES